MRTSSAVNAAMVASAALAGARLEADDYQSFHAAIYARAYEVREMADLSSPSAASAPRAGSP